MRLLLAVLCAVAVSLVDATWLWTDTSNPTPVNEFNIFRVDFTADPVASATAFLAVATDSQAAVYINGQPIMRKMTRFKQPDVRSQVFDLSPSSPLHGLVSWGNVNTLLVEHFNFGPITCFQRDGQAHAGLWVNSSIGVSTGAGSWKWIRSPTHLPLTRQVLGVSGTPRIRFPQIVDQRKALPQAVFLPKFDTSSWSDPVVLTNPIWSPSPPAVETVPQVVGPYTNPQAVLAAGYVTSSVPINNTDGWNMNQLTLHGSFTPSPDVTAAARAAVATSSMLSVSLTPGGNSVYVTYDLHQPLHFYPVVSTSSPSSGVYVDLTYTEKPFDQRSGEVYVNNVTGAINPRGIVGDGYGDRVIVASGSTNNVTLPDERTARWVLVQVHCVAPDCTAPVTVDLQLFFERTGYPTPAVGTFTAGLPGINAITTLSQQFAVVSMSDALVDTPGREDGSWVEDARPRGKIASRWYGDDGKLSALLSRNQAEQGAEQPFAPSNFNAGSPFDWAVQWTAAMHDVYMWTGKLDVTAAWWDVLVAFWDRVITNVDQTNGVWYEGFVNADIRVGVHCGNQADCTSCIVTPWMIERLRWSAAMATGLGNTTVASYWSAQASLMTKGFQTYCIAPASGSVPAHVPDIAIVPRSGGAIVHKGYSQAGQTVAVWTEGLLTPEQAQATVDYAFPAPAGFPPAGVQLFNNPTYLYRSLRAMTAVNLTGRAVAFLQNRFQQYLPNNPANTVPLNLQGPYGGPLPEYWVSRVDMGLTGSQVDGAQPVDGTGSHGWCSVALLWQHEMVLGVTITKPGGQELRVAPDGTGLGSIDGTTAVPTGTVHVTFNKTANTLELTVPAVETVNVVTPPTCLSGMKPTSSPSKASVTPSSDGYTITGSTAGAYTFVCA